MNALICADKLFIWDSTEARHTGLGGTAVFWACGGSGNCVDLAGVPSNNSASLSDMETSCSSAVDSWSSKISSKISSSARFLKSGRDFLPVLYFVMLHWSEFVTDGAIFTDCACVWRNFIRQSASLPTSGAVIMQIEIEFEVAIANRVRFGQIS